MDFTNPSTRRIAVAAMAPIFAVLNAKLGLNITPEVQEGIFALLGLYLVASNTKEAVIKRAELAGQKAASEVKDPAAVIKEASK